MSNNKVFRIGEGTGPDYKCSKCGLIGHRLWRESNVFLVHVELKCAVCAEAEQTEEIARYAQYHQEHETTIGDLVPARATPDGDTFWGHTSGDVGWWYRLPMYQDSAREMARLRIERDRFQDISDEYATMYRKERDRVFELTWKVERVVYRVARPFGVTIWGTVTKPAGEKMVVRYGEESLHDLHVGDRIAVWRGRADLVDQDRRGPTIMDFEQNGEHFAKVHLASGYIQRLPPI